MQNSANTESSDTESSEYVTRKGFSIRRGTILLNDRAVEFQVHPKTLVRECDAGRLSFIRIGDRRYLSERHIADWLASLESGRVAPTSKLASAPTERVQELLAELESFLVSEPSGGGS